ncbi:MAG: hypothetical protein OXI29_09380 [bacterium]|nr:hypothetical protein [bacterium]
MRGIGGLAGENVGVQMQGQTPDLPDGLDCVDSDLLADLRNGVIDKLPESALDCLPPNVRDDIPLGLIDFATANPELALAAVIVAVVATLVFLYKLAKRAFFVALIAGAVAVVAWWWWLAEPNIF